MGLKSGEESLVPSSEILCGPGFDFEVKVATLDLVDDFRSHLWGGVRFDGDETVHSVVSELVRG